MILKPILTIFFTFIGTVVFCQDVSYGTISTTSINSASQTSLRIIGQNDPVGIASSRNIAFEFQSAGKAQIRSYRGSSWGTSLEFLTSDEDNLGGAPSIRMHIGTTGNIGIGTTAPSEKLSVNGKIRAKEIKVENANWPDFVFTKSYKLPTLKETEAHIKEKGHLPGIPSAAEVKADGVDLGDMNAKLLQKIEELTLHLIEQNKMLQVQQKEIIILKSKVKTP